MELTSAALITIIVGVLIIALIAIAASKLEEIKKSLDSLSYYVKEIERKTGDPKKK